MARRNLLLQFRYAGHPWPAGICSCNSGMPAIHGPPESAPAIPVCRPSMARKKREMPAEAGISGRALARVSASGD
jgi:hypothetical protein